MVLELREAHPYVWIRACNCRKDLFEVSCELDICRTGVLLIPNLPKLRMLVVLEHSIKFIFLRTCLSKRWFTHVHRKENDTQRKKVGLFWIVAIFSFYYFRGHIRQRALASRVFLLSIQKYLSAKSKVS